MNNDNVTPDRSVEDPDDHRVIRLDRRNLAVDVEQPELRQGTKPGQRFLRIPRQHERRFEVQEGYIQATDAAIRPRSGFERAWRGLRKVAVGSPLATHQAESEKLPKAKALAVFSSDALSSSAYATDEILIVLSAGGIAALTNSLWLAGLIALLLGIVALSYRQTIKAYPDGGGAYIVSKENLGAKPGLVAAASLAVDYVLTVAVSIAAGVLAITSAFPELGPYRVEIAVGAIALITLANLRGLRESGTIFAIPTYGFIVSFALLIVAGLVRTTLDPGLTAEIPESAYEPGVSAISAFLLLRAFSSGCTALTGIEAISNGIPAFRAPSSRNASITLMWMAAILTTLFLGITFLAHQLEVHPSEHISVPAQIGLAIFGEGILFYVIQAFTALILILAANTSYADFPRLASILARDRYLPHQFTYRGDRLAFSNGIILLGIAASVLVVAFSADVTRLIPLYAFGVFVSFTFSQTGMVRHWLRLREPGWRKSVLLNGFGALATGVVAVIVGVTKFEHGAWISMAAMIFLAIMFWTINRHFQLVAARLSTNQLTPRVNQPVDSAIVIVPLDDFNRATLQTLKFARGISQDAVAVFVTDDHDRAEELRVACQSAMPDLQFVIIDSPYRSFVSPFLSYLDAVSAEGARPVTVVVAEFLVTFPWERWLHNQSTRRLRSVLRHRPNTVVVEVPYDLAHEAEEDVHVTSRV